MREVNKLLIWTLNPVDRALRVQLVRHHGDESAFNEYQHEALHKEFDIKQAIGCLAYEPSDPSASGQGY
ncbi:hypothetical protein [Hymenobacter sp. YC55]|uniref:hypothetical protein n=1 Tax=Hymenobacter sp. YC55 TaxID=3034019 RepID=UPI0023F9DC54|nr:hypothetical protein [Hymenobacter sp. YC55]MDF7815391.1 hypothetical protein [Hymenobacter sp. YC55]